MDRLTSLLILTLLLGLPGTAAAQHLRLTVAGDVERADTLELPAAPVYLQELLKSAGIQGNGSAVILHGDSLRSAYSEFISAQTSGQQSQLKHGDIVVFHQVDAQPSATGHVVVIADIPRIVRLDAIEGRLANLLAAFRVAIGPADRVPVIRTAGGSAVSRSVLPGEVLMHGDVVQLNRIAELDPGYIHQLFGNPLAQEARAVESPTPATPPVQTIASEQTVLQLPQLPEPNAAAQELMLPSAVSEVSESPEPESRIPVVAAAVETVLPHKPPAEAPPIEPVVPPTGSVEPFPGEAAAAEVSPIWNVVFILGMLGSLTLVITGWLKTRREARLVADIATPVTPPQVPQETPVPAPAPSIASTWVAREELPSSSFADDESTFNSSLPAVFGESGDSFAPAAEDPRKPSAVTAPNTSDAADRLVQDQEWLGGDWRDQVVSGAPAPAPQEAPAPEPVPEDAPPIKPLISASEVAPPQMPVEPPQPQDATPAPLMTEAADDLEDLIQNRLPLELRQADLPLRVNLFGRPAGPRRLRIDAAHTEIAAPKFAASRRASRAEAPQATTAAQDPAVTLDRALNSLKEQGQ